MITIPRPRQPRLVVAVAAGLLLVATTTAATWLTSRPPANLPTTPATAREDAVVPAVPPAGADDRILERYATAIRAWTESLEASSANYLAATNLGIVYAGRARLTGDLADYARALQFADRALDLDPTYLPARELRATVLLATHRFSEARTEAQNVFDADPMAFQALATVGDASLELGDLGAARAAFERLASVSPSPPVWSRLANLFFVEGDAEVALTHIRNAIAGTDPMLEVEDAAFYAFQLGELLRLTGEVAEAGASFESALDLVPGHVPATAGLARVREAQGHRGEAIRLLEGAIEERRDPQLIVMLGDLYALDGNQSGADEQYARFEGLTDGGSETASVYRRWRVLYAVDHGRDVESAVALAQADLAERQDIHAYDALAWALYGAGRFDEAAVAAERALSLGTRDLQLAYHAGMIAAARGDGETARLLLERAVAGAVALPPLQVLFATDALAALGSW